ncbi:MAG: bifunctional o-acetylhomoserine/o-acetylserine sulfhydrylase [Actinobacteria bacterium]|nr:bifunctional o-acetylhomoserine/o-acetylserine sulfhydrylase [Actinomycetota bacterium]
MTMNNDSKNWGFETKQIHAGYQVEPTTGSIVPPIYDTAAYLFKSAEHARNLFGLSAAGNIYTRINNPTQDFAEQRIAALEGGTGALLVSSGQAAETYSILNIANAGDHIVASSRVYGGAYSLMKYTLPKLGIQTTFIDDQDDLAAWEAAIQPNTKLFYGESLGNPRVAVLDIEGISEIAHRHGLPMIVDNTVATPYLLRPFEHGADIVIHSATKFLSGHGTVIAGVIVDGGKFKWSKSDKFPGLTAPDPSYNGIVYTDALGDELAYIVKARVQLLRDMGSSIAPTSAHELLQGMSTLSMRMDRHNENAVKVATWLSQHPQVEFVNYAGIPSSPDYAAGQKYAPRGCGAVMSFEIKGGSAMGEKFVESVKLFKHVANIGDVRSLLIHPASTTHAQLNPAQQLASGVTPGLIRLSIGLETIDDIIADLELGFAATA